MRKFTKALSVVLALMMILCTVSAMSFTASAAETNKVNLTSNVGDTVSYDYSADSTQVTVTYKLKSDIMIENIQAVVSYDSKVLKLTSSNTKKTVSPTLYGTSGAGFEANLGLKDMIKFNATNIDGYDFTKGATIFTAVFDIVGSGNTTVDFDVYILTGTQNSKDVKMVYKDEVVDDNFTVTASGNVNTPVTGDLTLKFIVPKTKSSPKCWDSGIYLAYSNNYALNGFTKIPLVKTTDYLTPELKTDRLVSDTYAMYKVDLTEEQAKAINEATYVILVNSSNTYRTYVSGKYNILRAPVGVDADEYNTAKTSIANLNGYTFIMNGEVETGTSIQGYGTYTGYWTKCTNLQVVAPSASIWNNCWNQGVYIGYSNNYVLNTFTKIKMTRTSTFVDVTTNTTQLLSGSYPVYTVSLTEEQVAAIDAATYVIFENASGTYRTYINGKYNVLRAAVDEYSDTYGAKASVADRANNTFILCGGVKTGTSIEGYGTFTGYWSTKELEIVESEATLYCVFPAPAKNSKAMDNGVYLAYGNSNASGDLTYLAMEKTTDVYTPSLKTNQLKAGKYSVYKITLSGSELEAVDNAKNVIFSNKTGVYRTLLSPTYNVLNAKSGSYSAVYNTAKFVAEDHNGETFVVCDSKVTGTSTDGYGTFLGYWDLGE